MTDTGLWEPAPLVRARRQRAEAAAELESINERRQGAQRGLAELAAKYERKQAEIKMLDAQIKEFEAKV